MAPDLPDWLFIACGLSWGAGLIHLSAAIGHVHESRLYALCFALLAPLQLGWGVLVCRRGVSGRGLLFGALLSLGVICVWALSRTVGLPIGPHPWRPEELGAVDVIASGDELALCIVVVLGWCSRGGRRVPAVAMSSVVNAAAVTLIVLSSLALLAAGHTS